MKHKLLTIGAFFYDDFSTTFPILARNLAKSDLTNVELLIIDNGSALPIKPEDCKPFNAHVIRLPKNAGIGRAKEVLVKHAEGKYVWIVNTDDIFTFNLEELIPQMEGVDVGIINPLNTTHVYEGVEIKQNRATQNFYHSYDLVFDAKWAKENELFYNWHYNHDEFSLNETIGRAKPKMRVLTGLQYVAITVKTPKKIFTDPALEYKSKCSYVSGLRKSQNERKNIQDDVAALLFIYRHYDKFQYPVWTKKEVLKKIEHGNAKLLTFGKWSYKKIDQKIRNYGFIISPADKFLYRAHLIVPVARICLFVYATILRRVDKENWALR